MAKPSTPSRAPRNAPQSGKEHRYVGALVRDDFGRMSLLTTTTANAWAKKKLDHASQTLQLRNERNEKKARRAEAREYRRAEAGLQAELRESDHRARLLSRLLRTKVKPEKKLRHTPPRARVRKWPFTSVALPRYDGPIIDRRGERGVFARFRYYSRRTALAGVSQRVLTYCWNGAELDAAGNPYSHSNVGETIDEAMSAFDHLEQVNWSAQKGAKLLMHGILAMDHRQTPDEMMEVGVRWAEESLGRFDLPYLITLHAPPPDGDQRNWHCHVLWSFRPMERVGDHEWVVGEMLRTDLDNPQAMKLMREMFAAVMTNASLETGHNQVWTAKSNADRGLPHEPQVHLGAAKTNRARSGEYVADNEENHERVLRSKAAVIDDRLRHLDEALAQEQAVQRSIARRWVRLPAAPMHLPQPAVASTLTAALPVPKRALPLAPPIIVPALMPTMPSMPAPVVGVIAPVTVQALSVVDIAAVSPNVERRLPQSPSVVAHVEFANLRKSLAAVDPPTRAAPVPIAPSHPASVTPLPSIPAIRRSVDPATMPVRSFPGRAAAAPVEVFPRLPPILKRADLPASPGLLPRMPPRATRLSPLAALPADVPMLRLDPIHAARRLLAGRLRADDERRKREETEAAAKAVADQGQVDVASIERRRQTAEACRILSQSPRRPYRIRGPRVFLDLDVMGRRERKAVEAIGLGERQVADALLARVRRDQAEDERARTSGLPGLRPLDEIAILGRVADQQQAATRAWVISGRLDPSEPSAALRGTAAEAKHPPTPSAAAIAARLGDRQRDN